MEAEYVQSFQHSSSAGCSLDPASSGVLLQHVIAPVYDRVDMLVAAQAKVLSGAAVRRKLAILRVLYIQRAAHRLARSNAVAEATRSGFTM